MAMHLAESREELQLLSTGSALAAPAHRPLRVFTVTREGDLLRVSADAPPIPAEPAPRGPQRIVIIGGGAAGAFAAFELRRLGYAGSVTLLTRESRVPYDKPNLSKDYLAGKAPDEWIPLRTEADYAADDITLRLGAEVASIDTAAHEVQLADGERLPYDRLILATGASPRRLDIGGDGVHYLRTWNDADAILAATKDARRAVVLGASFIGLETAASLRERGLVVTVVGPEERPLEKVLGRELAAFVQRTHESHGVRFRLGRHPVEIRRDAVVLDDGSSEPYDVVIVGIGVTPDVALAERAGITVDNGIVVDEYLQTSAPDVFAAGDVARYPRGGARIRVEHWVAAGRQGQAAARNALGLRESFTAAPFFWSQHYDLVLAYVGHAASAADAETFGSWDAHDAAAVYRQEGKVTAVATLFRDDISLAVEAAMERGEDVLDIVRRGFEK